jgi:diguanylate cyclase
MGGKENMSARRLGDRRLPALGQTVRQEFFGRIVEHTAAAIAISDMRALDQPLVYVNAAFELLTGYSSDDVIGKNCRFMQGPIRDQSEVVLLREAIAQGRQVRTMIRNYKKTGEVFWNDLTLAPMHDAEGKVTHYFSICFDVSASVEQKEEAEKLSANWKALVDVSMALTFIVDKAGVITFESDSVSRMTGLAPGAAVGRSWFDLLHVEDRDAALAALDRLLDKECEFVSFDIVGRNASSERVWLGCKARNALEHPTVRGIVISAQDVTSDRVVRQLAYDATHDALTNIYNRHHLRKWYEERQREGVAAHHRVVLWLIDLDQFKSLNDSFGHSAGDEFLCRYAQALKAGLGSHWQVARLGGDEFAVMGETATPDDDMAAVSAQILKISQLAHPVEGTTIALSASVGVTSASWLPLSFDEMLRNADIAMYVAKRRGRNGYEAYDTEKGRDALERNALMRDVATALVRGEFCVAHQPIVDARTGVVTKYEALLRWQHPSLGLLSANHFIDELSLTGMCEDVTLWVLEQSLRQHRTALATGEVRISLNVWARSFRQPDFAQKVMDSVRSFGLAPQCLEVEIVETEFVLAGAETTENLLQLGKNGVRIIIDDFGKGFSNLGYLQRLNVQGIKIDSSFVWALGVDAKSEKLVRGLLGLAKELEIDVVAEGIETEAQRAFLLSEGCFLHQGFLYGRPSILAP